MANQQLPGTGASANSVPAITIVKEPQEYWTPLPFEIHDPAIMPGDWPYGASWVSEIQDDAHANEFTWNLAASLLNQGYRLSVICLQREAVQVAAYVVSQIPGGALAGYEERISRVIFWRIAGGDKPSLP